MLEFIRPWELYLGWKKWVLRLLMRKYPVGAFLFSVLLFVGDDNKIC